MLTFSVPCRWTVFTFGGKQFIVKVMLHYVERNSVRMLLLEVARLIMLVETTP